MILTPLLVLLTFLGVQTAIYFHAANVAAAGAAQGAAAGAARGNGEGRAAEVAQRTVVELGGQLVGAPGVAIDGEFVSVTVVVEVQHILPFFPDSVSRSAVEPRERYVAEADR